MAPVDALAELVRCVAKTSVTGGRCVVIDENRCVLYDCANWTAAMAREVGDRFPLCSVSVSSLSESISGFVVVFQLHTRRNRLLGVAWLGFGVCASVLFTWYVLQSVRLALGDVVRLVPAWLHLPL